MLTLNCCNHAINLLNQPHKISKSLRGGRLQFHQATQEIHRLYSSSPTILKLQWTIVMDDWTLAIGCSWYCWCSWFPWTSWTSWASRSYWTSRAQRNICMSSLDDFYFDDRMMQQIWQLPPSSLLTHLPLTPSLRVCSGRPRYPRVQGRSRT